MNAENVGTVPDKRSAFHEGEKGLGEMDRRRAGRCPWNPGRGLCPIGADLRLPRRGGAGQSLLEP